MDDQGKDAREDDLMFRAILDNAPLPILISSIADGTIFYVNMAFSTLMGRKHGDLIGQRTSDFFANPSERAGLIQKFRQEGTLRNRELHLKRSDGSPLWGLASLQMIQFNGQPCALTVFSDITERKAMEQAMEIKTRLLAVLQRIAADVSEASTMEQALQICLDHVCAYRGWQVGHAYTVDEDSGALVPTSVWHLDDPPRFASLREITEVTRFTSGVGLPGRVLASGKPAWVWDVTGDENFPRGKHASEAGVKAAFAFPVLVGGQVIAVLEFLFDNPAEPDEPLLEIMDSIGHQLGRVADRIHTQVLQEQMIAIQAAALNELSTPLIPISDRVVVMPLIGAIDSRRAQQVIETLLEGIGATGAEVAILDITGVPLVDTHVANGLIRAAQAVKLLGARVVLTGIRPEVAQTLVGMGVDLQSIVTRGTLQSGVAYAFGRGEGVGR